MPPRVEFVERNVLPQEIHQRSQKDQQHDQHQSQEQQPSSEQQGAKKYNIQIVWRNVILMTALHIGAFVGLKQCIFSAQWKTVIFAYLLYILGGIGITAGAHRLWAHRSYKAKMPLRILLAFLQTLAFQNSIYEWSRDHRVHHKYSETDADPHNALRGFFFSHVGWLLCRKHPEVKAKGKQIDMTDLVADPIVRFQHRHYLPLMFLSCFVIPTMIPYLLWGETFYNSFYICALLKYTITLHGTWLVNSAAHMWGNRPYDKSINPSENRFCAFFAVGEGFHNYHHTFPWDYATSELGYDLNLTKLFIDIFASIGWAYERKVVRPEMIYQRKVRTGELSDH